MTELSAKGQLSSEFSLMPYTGFLHRYVSETRVNPDVRELARKEPDLVCLPGHDFIYRTSVALHALAFPGDQPVTSYEGMLNRMTRAFCDFNAYRSFLPLIGRYIVYLWLVRRFVQRAEPLWFSNDLLREDVRFTPNIADEGFNLFDELCARNSASMLALPPDKAEKCFVSVESFWLIEFIVLSEKLEEPQIDLIPPYYRVKKTGLRKQAFTDPKANQFWLEWRKHLEETAPEWPFRLMLVKGSDDIRVIRAISQCSHIFRRLICEMSGLEHLLRIAIEEVVDWWNRMRSGAQIKYLPHADFESLKNLFLSQTVNWPEQTKSDDRLFETASSWTYLSEKTAKEKEEDPLSQAMRKLFNPQYGIRRGSHGRKPELDDAAQKAIISLKADLDVIHRAVWPRVLDHQEEALKQLKSLCESGSFSMVQWKHLKFLEDKFKAMERNEAEGKDILRRNDPFDLRAKVVQKYLQLEPSNALYSLKPIKQLLRRTS